MSNNTTNSTNTTPAAAQSEYERLTELYNNVSTATVAQPKEFNTSLLGAIGDTYRLAKYIVGGTIHMTLTVIQQAPAFMAYIGTVSKEMQLQIEATMKDVTPEEMEKLNELFSQMDAGQQEKIRVGTIRRMLIKIRNEL